MVDPEKEKEFTDYMNKMAAKMGLWIRSGPKPHLSEEAIIKAAKEYYHGIGKDGEFGDYSRNIESVR